jgi:hypothetical protein
VTVYAREVGCEHQATAYRHVCDEEGCPRHGKEPEEGRSEVEAGPMPTAPCPCTRRGSRHGQRGDDYVMECECGPEDEDHDWQSPHALVGGVKENPGVWSGVGTTYLTLRVCVRCGTYRHETDRGSQRNPGELPVEVSYEPADQASLAWAREQHEDEQEA